MQQRERTKVSSEVIPCKSIQEFLNPQGFTEINSTKSAEFSVIYISAADAKRMVASMSALCCFVLYFGD